MGQFNFNNDILVSGRYAIWYRRGNPSGYGEEVSAWFTSHSTASVCPSLKCPLDLHYLVIVLIDLSSRTRCLLSMSSLRGLQGLQSSPSWFPCSVSASPYRISPV